MKNQPPKILIYAILYFVFAAVFVIYPNLAFSECKTIILLGNEFSVSGETTSPDLGWEFSVAYNSVNNEYIVVWSELTTLVPNIFGQRISSVGELLDSRITVYESEDAQIEPFIVHNFLDNEYLTVWRTQQPGFFNALLGRRITNTGTLIGNDFFIADGGFEGRIAYSSTANEYFVTARKIEEIVGQRISNIGALIGSPANFGDPSSSAPNGHVVYNAIEDEFFATYRNQGIGRLEGQRILSSGSLAGNPTIISTLFPGSTQKNEGRIAFDPTRNRYLVVFDLFQEDGIVGQFVSSDGQPVGSSFYIASAGSGANVAYNGINDCFLVAWTDDFITGRLVSGGGELSSDTFIISTETSSCGPPGLAYNSQTSEFLVTWADSRDTNDENIFGQLVYISASNQPPEAICQDVTVSTDPGLCTADASIDDGSFDPDGDEITLDQEPPGPYPLGVTVVTLTVTDDKADSATCDATVTVMTKSHQLFSR